MYSNPKLAEYKAFLKGKTASVIGVGISNIPLIDFLLENGVTVTARDKKDREKLIANPRLDMQRLEQAGVRFITGENYLSDIKEQIVFKSPGVRFDKPEILEAYRNGSLITSEMEAFLSLCPAKIIAVTGSNGKTTTTTLVSEMLKNAGHTVWLGGNIGKPLLPDIEKIEPGLLPCLSFHASSYTPSTALKTKDCRLRISNFRMSAFSPISRPITSIGTPIWRNMLSPNARALRI